MNLGVASATSICSSLSTAACFNLQSADCAQFGSGTSSGQFIVATGTNAAGAMITVGPMLAVAGLGLGIMGQMV
jgi:hypothetical protein